MAGRLAVESGGEMGPEMGPVSGGKAVSYTPDSGCEWWAFCQLEDGAMNRSKHVAVISRDIYCTEIYLEEPQFGRPLPVNVAQSRMIYTPPWALGRKRRTIGGFPDTLSHPQ